MFKIQHLILTENIGYPLQGVFINPALVEPFGLTLIEVSFSSSYLTMSIT